MEVVEVVERDGSATEEFEGTASGGFLGKSVENVLGVVHS